MRVSEFASATYEAESAAGGDKRSAAGDSGVGGKEGGAVVAKGSLLHKVCV